MTTNFAKKGIKMTGRKVRQSGVNINGKWYWDEALYGLCGTVFCGEPAGNRVDIYDRGMQRICTATLVEKEI